MNYKFPRIVHLDEVRTAVKDLPEFIIAERDWGYVANYVVSTKDTFPAVQTSGGSAKMRAEATRAKSIRRECRGLLFDRNGCLISRPFHKFFNVGEKDETLPEKIDLSHPHVILEKLDGSMVRPFPVEDGFRLATKMGITDVSMQAEVFVADHPNYDEFIRLHLERGQTPIFEWCSRKQRIVLDYPVDRLVLTAIREINSGEYKSYQQMLEYGDAYNVEVVRAYEGTLANMESLVHETRGLQGQEGWVIRFDDGHMAKIKSEEYVTIHRAKENILREKNVIEMLITEAADDVKPFLQADDLKKLEDYETVFWKGIADTTDIWQAMSNSVHRTHGVDRKSFALSNTAQIMDGNLKSTIFRAWEEPDFNWRQAVINVVAKNLSTQTKVDNIRGLFGGAKWAHNNVGDEA